MSINGRLKGLLKDGVGAVVSSPENRRHLTGFPSSDGFLLLTKEEALFLTDSRYTEAAGRAITTCLVAELMNAKEQLFTFFADRGIRRVLLESDKLTVADFTRLKEYFKDIEVLSDGTLDKKLCALRAVKTKSEITAIKSAQRIAERAFDHILGYIRPGLTEKEIALELDYAMLHGGAEALSFETIAVSGENSSLPHGVPSQRKVRKGDFLTLDFGAVVKGYHSDMTRTVILGMPNEEQLLIYDTVLTAQRTALEVLRPGVTGIEADRAARDIITAAGYGARFGHGTGHGVGLEIHELPSLSPRSKDTLKKGNVVTVEPGIYLPGKFGVRIEDMAVITNDGYENLTKAEKELIVL